MRLLVATLVALVAAAPAAAATVSFFETPSKNIVCAYFSGAGSPPTLECGVVSGMHPAAPKPPSGCHTVDPASNRIRLGGTGKVYGFCSGDAGVFAEAGRANVLAYGKTWQKGPFRCTSTTTGLTCKNTAGHGFFLSRQSWRSF